MKGNDEGKEGMKGWALATAAAPVDEAVGGHVLGGPFDGAGGGRSLGVEVEGENCNGV